MTVYVPPGRKGRNIDQFAEQIDFNVRRAFDAIYGVTAAETSAGVTPVDFRYLPHIGLRYSSFSEWISVDFNIYVSVTDGDDSNDGLTSGAPLQTLQAAFNLLAQYASAFPGADFIVNLAAGTYTEGGEIPTGTRTRDWITIKGPSVSNAAGNSVDLSFDEETATGTFQASETVTGGTSGATGTVSTVGTRFLVVSVSSGSFSAGETITGGTSAATCVARGGRPVPTAIIDGTSASKTVGILATGRQKVKIQNVKVQDFSSTGNAGVRASDHCTVHLDNVHIDNCYNGWYFLDFTFYTAVGGLVNGGEHGIQELFHVVRNTATVDSLDEGTEVRGATFGLFAKEHCTGHLDWTTLDGNTYGVFFSRSCTANASDCQITNNTNGAVLRHGSYLVQLRIDWGIGTDDANTVNWLVDHSSGFTTNENNVGDDFTAQGERVLGYYTPATPEAHTGTTAETRLFNFGSLKGGAFSKAGTYMRAIIHGVKSGTADTASILLDINDDNAATITVPATATGFQAEVVFTSLGSESQYWMSRLVSAAGNTVGRDTRAYNLDTGAGNKVVGIDCVLADAADSITIEAAWLYTTDALLPD